MRTSVSTLSVKRHPLEILYFLMHALNPKERQKREEKNKETMHSFPSRDASSSPRKEGAPHHWGGALKGASWPQLRSHRLAWTLTSLGRWQGRGTPGTQMDLCVALALTHNRTDSHPKQRIKPNCSCLAGQVVGKPASRWAWN